MGATSEPEAVLPASIALGHVVLQVGNLERSVVYYQTVLGLRALRRDATSASLGTEDGRTLLVELHESASPSVGPKRRSLGLYHFAILLPDRASLGRFIMHLSRLGLRAGSADHLVSEALYLNDPDDLGIEVYADRPRERWQMNAAELRMASDPLDIGDLVAAADGKQWTGMPAGTTMGHVHLHVGNLDNASAFYHSALGLDRRVWSYPGALFLAAGGYHHHLGVNTWAGAHAKTPLDDDARMLEWQMKFSTPGDVATVAQRLDGKGFSPIRDGDDWLATDPWGMRLRLTSAG